MSEIWNSIASSLVCYTSSFPDPVTFCDVRRGEGCSIMGPSYGCSTSRDQMSCHVSLCNAPMEVFILFGVILLLLGIVLLTGCCFCCFCCCCGKCFGARGSSICHFCPIHRIYPRPISIPVQKTIHHHHGILMPSEGSGSNPSVIENETSINMIDNQPITIYPTLVPSAPPPPPDYGTMYPKNDRD